MVVGSSTMRHMHYISGGDGIFSSTRPRLSAAVTSLPAAGRDAKP